MMANKKQREETPIARETSTIDCKKLRLDTTAHFSSIPVLSDTLGLRLVDRTIAERA